MSTYDLPPEPPHGATVYDRHGRAWHCRDGVDHADGVRRKRWVCDTAGYDDRLLHWGSLLLRHGPLTDTAAERADWSALGLTGRSTP